MNQLPDFTMQDLLSILQAQAAEESDGLSVQELVAKTGQCHNWVLSRLHALQRGGELIVERKRVRRIDGIPAWVPAYRIKKGEGQ